MGGLVPCLFYVNVGEAGVGRLGCASWKGGRGGMGGLASCVCFFLSVCEYYNKRRGVLAVQARPRGASCTRDPGSSEGRDRQSLWSAAVTAGGGCLANPAAPVYLYYLIYLMATAELSYFLFAWIVRLVGIAKRTEYIYNCTLWLEGITKRN